MRSISLTSAAETIGSRVGGATGMGGTRTACPAANRADASTRWPSTRICPVRHSFCNAPCVSAG